ncbi:hypothetical protein CC79DRAFT_422540 [Sarocladium strictum]
MESHTWPCAILACLGLFDPDDTVCLGRTHGETTTHSSAPDQAFRSFCTSVRAASFHLSSQISGSLDRLQDPTPQRCIALRCISFGKKALRVHSTPVAQHLPYAVAREGILAFPRANSPAIQIDASLG